ncbi:MAG: 30S ribosomal protein S6 [Desulfobacula sp.]|jgi:small subunit ribosomal protein S6|nr:30S ribosomal protein S6 [Desulfobacula sp.]
MRKYETVFIADPDLQDKVRIDLYEKARNIINKEGGILTGFDEWGNKKLAYEIKKKLRGNYVCITYGGSGSLVKELERNFRLNDGVLKFMTILLSDDVTAEQLEKEVQDAQDAQDESKKAAETVKEPVKADKPEEETSVEAEKVEETEVKTE